MRGVRVNDSRGGNDIVVGGHGRDAIATGPGDDIIFAVEDPALADAHISCGADESGDLLIADSIDTRSTASAERGFASRAGNQSARAYMNIKVVN